MLKEDSEWKQWSIFFCISEGEQAEAWLKEAGLEGLYDSSLEGNSDQVSLVYSSFSFAVCTFEMTYMWVFERINRKKTTWGSCRRWPERRRQLSNVGWSRPTRHSGGVTDSTFQMSETFSDLRKWWGEGAHKWGLATTLSNPCLILVNTCSLQPGECRFHQHKSPSFDAKCTGSAFNINLWVGNDLLLHRCTKLQ